MHQNLAEQIREKCERLPPALQREALDFIEFLEKKHLPAASAESNKRNLQPLTNIWEAFEAITNAIPAEELAKLPADGSINVDKYLYGGKR